MNTIDLLLANLLSPIVLAFVLGIIASLIHSDLKLPDAVYTALSIYLLLAIGLKGGVELSKTPFAVVLGPVLITLVLGILTPLTSFFTLKLIGRFDSINAAAIAAHYGSVSAVTFIATRTFVELAGVPAEGFMPALVALLEIPGIIIALMLAQVMGAQAGNSWQEALREVVTGRSIILLLGGLLIGFLAGEARMTPVQPFFVTGFQGALTLFLLELGIVAALRLRDLRSVGMFLVAFGTILPIIHGLLGVWLGHLVGLSVGGSTILGAMASSASYIAAPAAVRIALPQANPTYYLTAALGITFPFNLTLGIPLYFLVAQWIGG
jgi:hypothetical protein